MVYDERRPGWRGDVELAIDAWQEFLGADGFNDAAEVASNYGWLPPAFGVLAFVFFRGLVVYVTEPVVIKQGYIFSGWVGALFLNLLFTLFLAGLIWFFFFGTAGALAGLLVGQGLNTDIFKAGGYLAMLFVPISMVSFALALTISPNEIGVAAITGSSVEDVAPQIMDVRMNIRTTRQMQVVRLFRMTGWITATVLLRPMLAVYYDCGFIRSVVALLLPTAAAVLAALLL